MTSIAAVVVWNNVNERDSIRLVDCLHNCASIKAIAALSHGCTKDHAANIDTINVSNLWSKKAVTDTLKWFGSAGAEDLMLITGSGFLTFYPDSLRRMYLCLHDSAASVVYGDYYEILEDGSLRLHPLIDYQTGSIRDDFDFGMIILINGSFLGDIRKSIEQSASDFLYGGLYDLRLRLSEKAPIVHIPEPLYCCKCKFNNSTGSDLFAYVDPSNRNFQVEMEKIATDHLKRIGAFIQGPASSPPEKEGNFPVEASVVIPVKNRVRTIGEAIQSALSQKTSFPYNVIVIDNHSEDGTTDIVSTIAKNDNRLVHIIPHRKDLQIGGCWNEAIYSDICGKYAVQLDSDDLYTDCGVLERIISEFYKKPYSLVIGSYTTVDFNLQPRPPGLVDHREWTDENGLNNILRVAGLGAPRAYHVPTLRLYGFPNVSYGEDYAVVLRLCRTYPVGRIYDPVYWCRRWEGNTDGSLSLETANRYNYYKDYLRTLEINSRMQRKDDR